MKYVYNLALKVVLSLRKFPFPNAPSISITLQACFVFAFYAVCAHFVNKHETYAIISWPRRQRDFILQ